MKQVNQKIELSDIPILLSNDIREFIKESGRGILKHGKKVAVYLRFQILFLFQFNYTKTNIKDHLMKKALAFFDVNFDDSTKGKKKKRASIKRLKSQKKLKRKIKAGRFTLLNRNKRVNNEKKLKNSYIPPG